MNESARSAVQIATGRAARTEARPARTAVVGRTGRRGAHRAARAAGVALGVARFILFKN